MPLSGGKIKVSLHFSELLPAWSQASRLKLPGDKETECVSSLTTVFKGMGPSLLIRHSWVTGWQEAYLAFKKMYVHIKGAGEGFTNPRFLKEMLEEKWRGTAKIPFDIYVH